MTRRLIEEKGFSAGAGEVGWPDAYRVNPLPEYLRRIALIRRR